MVKINQHCNSIFDVIEGPYPMPDVILGQFRSLPQDVRADNLRRPSVLLIGNFLSSQNRNPGVCEELANFLKQRNWPVTTTSGQPGRAKRLFDIVFTTWKKRKSFDVAQVDVFSGKAFILAEISCSLLRLLKKPFVLTLHGGNLPQFSQRWPRRTNRLLRTAAAVTAPSGYILEQFETHGRKIELVPNPIHLRAFPFKHRKKAQPHVIWLRAIHEIYDPLLAVKTIAGLAKTHPAIRLTMVGPDKRDGSLQKVIDLSGQLGVERHIKLIGRIQRKDVVDFLNAGDIFLNTSKVDNTPVSVIEAMACGLCIVSTNAGGIPWLLQDEKEALLTPVGGVEPMIGAIRRILDEPGLASRLSWQARKKAEQFDWSYVGPLWEKLLVASIQASQ